MPLDTVNDIRSMDAAGRSRSEIARMLHVSRNTVAKYADMEDMPPAAPMPRRRGRPALEGNEEWVAGVLEADLDWQHLSGRFREGQPRLPELDRRHVAQRRVDPKVVVPVRVVRELGPEPARRAESLAVEEMGREGVANADLTSRASFPGPADRPTTSLLQGSTSRQT